MPNKLAKKSSRRAGEGNPFEVGALGDLPRCSTKLVVKGLGFTRLNQVIERPGQPQRIRGMVAKVPHLVEIVRA